MYWKAGGDTQQGSLVIRNHLHFPANQTRMLQIREQEESPSISLGSCLPSSPLTTALTHPSGWDMEYTGASCTVVLEPTHIDPDSSQQKFKDLEINCLFSGMNSGLTSSLGVGQGPCYQFFSTDGRWHDGSAYNFSVLAWCKALCIQQKSYFEF